MSRLVKCWPNIKDGISLAVYTSHCIATRPPDHDPPTSRLYNQHHELNNNHKNTQNTPLITRALVNPSNEELIGTVLPYFPMAGPPPKDLFTTSWGGLSAGYGMFYSMQSVDGIVSLHGGAELRKACEALPAHENVELVGGGGNRSGGYGSVRCPVGSTAITKAFGDAIIKNYSFIIHTVPPLWPGNGGSKHSLDEAKSLLRSCYHNAFVTGFNAGAAIVSSPLIGSGARRAPVSTAIECAVKGVLDAIRLRTEVLTQTKEGEIDKSLELDSPPWPPVAAEFVLIEPRIASDLVNAIDHELEGVDHR